MSELKPGISVDVVLESDPNRLRKTIIYDIEGRKVILAQTSPPLLRSHLGEPVRVSFATKIKGVRDTRLAFCGDIVEFIRDYEMSSSQTVPAVVTEQRTELEEIDRRMFYRIAPSLNSGLEVLLGNEKISIIDISLGGAKLLHSIERMLQTNEQIALTILMDRQRFDVKARIVRVEQKFDPAKSMKTQTTSLQFGENSQEFGRALAKKMMLMERQRLAEGKY